MTHKRYWHPSCIVRSRESLPLHPLCLEEPTKDLGLYASADGHKCFCLSWTAEWLTKNPFLANLLSTSLLRRCSFSWSGACLFGSCLACYIKAGGTVKATFALSNVATFATKHMIPLLTDSPANSLPYFQTGIDLIGQLLYIWLSSPSPFFRFNSSKRIQRLAITDTWATLLNRRSSNVVTSISILKTVSKEPPSCKIRDYSPTSFERPALKNIKLYYK